MLGQQLLRVAELFAGWRDGKPLSLASFLTQAVANLRLHEIIGDVAAVLDFEGYVELRIRGDLAAALLQRLLDLLDRLSLITDFTEEELSFFSRSSRHSTPPFELAQGSCRRSDRGVVVVQPTTQGVDGTLVFGRTQRQRSLRANAKVIASLQLLSEPIDLVFGKRELVVSTNERHKSQGHTRANHEVIPREYHATPHLDPRHEHVRGGV
ncbi:MAG: hypothetical protein R3B07_34590 [Polyangiaceae bacterium]